MKKIVNAMAEIKANTLDRDLIVIASISDVTVFNYDSFLKHLWDMQH